MYFFNLVLSRFFPYWRHKIKQILLTLESNKDGFKLIQCLKWDPGQLAKIMLFFCLESYHPPPTARKLPPSLLTLLSSFFPSSCLGSQPPVPSGKEDPWEVTQGEGGGPWAPQTLPSWGKPVETSGRLSLYVDISVSGPDCKCWYWV